MTFNDEEIKILAFTFAAACIEAGKSSGYSVTLTSKTGLQIYPNEYVYVVFERFHSVTPELEILPAHSAKATA